jgi:hypothetical protein
MHTINNPVQSSQTSATCLPHLERPELVCRFMTFCDRSHSRLIYCRSVRGPAKIHMQCMARNHLDHCTHWSSSALPSSAPWRRVPPRFAAHTTACSPSSCPHLQQSAKQLEYGNGKCFTTVASLNHAAYPSCAGPARIWLAAIRSRKALSK